MEIIILTRKNKKYSFKKNIYIYNRLKCYLFSLKKFLI